jgi:hypothetical protein
MAIADRWRRLVSQGHGHLDLSAARLGLKTSPNGQPATGTRESEPAAVDIARFRSQGAI